MLDLIGLHRQDQPVPRINGSGQEVHPGTSNMASARARQRAPEPHVEWSIVGLSIGSLVASNPAGPDVIKPDRHARLRRPPHPRSHPKTLIAASGLRRGGTDEYPGRLDTAPLTH
jgi:hypothetical protein